MLSYGLHPRGVQTISEFCIGGVNFSVNARVNPSVKPFGLATSLVRGRLFSLAPLCKGGCQPFRLTEGLFLRLADTDNPSGASRHLPLHKGGFTGNYCQLEAAPRHLPFQGRQGGREIRRRTQPKRQ